MRNLKFQNDYYYHIYNRGIVKRNIFENEKDYFNFLIRLRDLNNASIFEQRIGALKEPSSLTLKELGSFPPFTNIITYCLNPNHFHLLLKQLEEKGIEKFMHKIGTGNTNYFNKSRKRSGYLCQGKFQAVEIKSDEHLSYISSYIHGNPEIHKIAKADKWIWSSYLDYLGKRHGTLCDKNIILKGFKNIDEYREYTNEVIENSKNIKEELKKYHIE
jgi:putative transposase